ncbi:MAG TPA: serine hydrolase domain-containing protein [Candidatus Dormibacteraeota bacterium]|nr:serine hydrolase domain-containing protein [Candidatus Dormibacteraeota bacterium]
MRRRLAAAGIVVAVLVLAIGTAAGLGPLASTGSSGTAPSADASPSSPAPSGSSGATASPTGAPSASVTAPPAPMPSPTAPPLPVAKLQSALDAWRTASATPGVSVTIRWADGRSWTGTASVADAAHATPMTPDTAFCLASITKTFVAALAIQLVGERRLTLDAPVAPLLPGLGLDRRITLRMLLDHTSGLPDIFMAPGIDRALLAAPDRAWTLAASLAFDRRPRAVPGTSWAYSNTNYLLLGVLLEKVTGQPFASLVRTRLLDPLGLRSAYVQIAEAAPVPVAVGHVVVGTGATARARVLHAGPVQPFTSVVSAGGAADDLSASSADVATWASLLYGGEVLGPASTAAMLGDIARVAPFHPRTQYGLGVEAYTMPGFGTVYGHNGHLAGFRDLVRYLPVQGLSIAILANADAAPIGPLLTRLLAVALPLGEPCARCR